MATLEDARNDPPAKIPNHQRAKSAIFRPFLHRRNNSDGSFLQPSSSSTSSSSPEMYSSKTSPRPGNHERAPMLEVSRPGCSGGMAPNAWPLGELQHNHQGQNQRSPRKFREEGRDVQPPSPQKIGTFATISLKARGTSRGPPKSRDPSPEKPKKTKSSTNLVGLLSRPKSNKNLEKLAAEDQARALKDKENRTPPSSFAGGVGPAPPPIYAQFCREGAQKPEAGYFPQLSNTGGDPFTGPGGKSYGKPAEDDRPSLKPRPKSFQPYTSAPHGARFPGGSKEAQGKPSTDDMSKQGAKKTLTWGRAAKTPRPNIFGVFSQRNKEPVTEPTEPSIDEKDVDAHLEAMLDRRNIPENQRYKMRNLNSTIKKEFIRQDWAETRAKNMGRPPSHGSDTSADGGTTTTPGEADSERRGRSKTKHSRVKSLTLSRSRIKSSASPSKKGKSEGTLGRHFRSKSTESLGSERPSSAGSASGGGGGGGIFSRTKTLQCPGDFVSYLRKVQKPELVEVGKLHKLRLLLRNETVSWAEDFIRQGGMKEVVGLLHRIMNVEWREEHEDALLHENLLCLKALCTTALALQYLHSIQQTLFPALIHLIFDPEKKGPSEFTTRNIITSVLLTYIESAPPAQRPARAQTVLAHLRDPEDKEEDRPVSFVLEMRRERPYRVWCKEVVNVTKEVFWIFLHNLNVVALPADQSTNGGQPISRTSADANSGANGASSPDQPPAGGPTSDAGGAAYMARHFPQERAPVPAAPYVGGVEWDATNYLASHLDLMNAILACTPTAADRRALRARLRVSGWERCMGGSLRLCKEKFYGAVHDGLRTWVAAAYDDSWDVRDVRYGPPPEPRSPVKKVAGAGGGGHMKKLSDEAPPQIQMPELEFQLDGPGL